MRNIATFIFVFAVALSSQAQGNVYSKRGTTTTMQFDSGYYISNYRKSIDFGSVKAKHLFIKYDTNAHYWIKNEIRKENKSEHAITILNFRGVMHHTAEKITAELVSSDRQWCLFRLGDTTNLLAGVYGNIKLVTTGKEIATHQQAVLNIEGLPNTTNIITTVPQGITKGRMFHTEKKFKNAAVFNQFTITTSNGEVLNFPSGTYYLFSAQTVIIQ